MLVRFQSRHVLMILLFLPPGAAQGADDFPFALLRVGAASVRGGPGIPIEHHRQDAEPVSMRFADPVCAGEPIPLPQRSWQYAEESEVPQPARFGGLP